LLVCVLLVVCSIALLLVVCSICSALLFKLFCRILSGSANNSNNMLLLPPPTPVPNLPSKRATRRVLLETARRQHDVIQEYSDRFEQHSEFMEITSSYKRDISALKDALQGEKRRRKSAEREVEKVLPGSIFLGQANGDQRWPTS
jgi:hypothetical protein